MNPSTRLLALAVAGSVIGLITAFAAPPAKRTHFTVAPVSATKAAPASKGCGDCAATAAAKDCGTTCGSTATVVRRAGANAPRQLPAGGCGQSCS